MTTQVLPEEEKTRQKRKVYIVLPVFNEEACIENLLNRIDEAMYEALLPYQVIIVDDGSQDKTVQIVNECRTRMPILVFRHDKNLGLGATIRYGLIEATNLASNKDVIVTMDADDTHSPGLIRRMVRMITEGHDVLIASRYQPGSRIIGVPFYRRILSYGASIIFRILFPTRGVKDFTCGYRAYRAEVVKEAFAKYGREFLDQDGFQCMVDLILKLRKMNLIFGELPFILRYDIKAGGTKMNVSGTIKDSFLLILKRRFGI